MSSLHFGFEEYRYPDGKTTVEVAAIIESKYHVVEHFLEFYGDEIQRIVGEAVHESQAVETADLGPVEELFREFLDAQEIERLNIPGVPTSAAKTGTRVTAGHKRRTQIPRPSFVDLGLYRDSFRAWLEP